MANPFTPRFVDLVRNTSTTVGTGDFVLGAAVNGFASFATALNVGDRFYYSAIGLDKPAEREVGRGTLLAGGKIGREPVSGAKTNFTTGTKSIALIAASEWFDQAQALVAGVDADPALTANSDAKLATQKAVKAYVDAHGSGGGGPEIAPVADRPGLAACPASVAYLHETGRAGTFAFDGSNLAAKVAVDPGQGIYVAPASDPTGASGAWVRQFSGAHNVKWFGAKGDGTSDDSAAVAAALAYLRDTVQGGYGYASGASTLFIPKGVYILGSTPLDVYGSIIVEGETASVGGGTVLKWTGACDGIRVQLSNTSGATSVGATGHSTSVGSIFRNLFLYGGFSAATEGEYHGFRLKASVAIEDCFIQNFPGDGIYANAAAGAGSPGEGNVNLSRFTRVGVQECRNGFMLKGADANACTFIACNAIANRAWGFADYSFLGNFYYGCHAAANGWDGAGLGATAPTACTYGGNRYYVKTGQAAAASTNAPSGTTADTAYWGYVGAGGAYAGVVAWASGTMFREGGAYYVDVSNNNNSTKFDGCYSEGDQNPSQLAACVMLAGGCHAAGIHGGALVRAVNNRFATGDLQVQGDLYVDDDLTASGDILAASLGVPNKFSVDANGNITSYGPQVAIGPAGTAATSDFTFYVNSTNVLTFFNFQSWSGGASNIDGGVGTARGGGLYLNAASTGPNIYFRPDSATNSAILTTSALNLATGVALQNNGTTVVNGSGTIVAPIASTGAITSSSATAGVGYAAGAGGAVTQATSKSTGVTLNKACGQITMSAAALAAAAVVEFTVTNSAIAATDAITLNLKSGASTTSAYRYWVSAVAAGSFKVCVENRSAGSLSEALVLNFAVKKAVAA